MADNNITREKDAPMTNHDIREVVTMLKDSVPRIETLAHKTHDEVIAIRTRCVGCQEAIGDLKTWRRQRTQDQADKARVENLALQQENSRLRNGRIRLYVIVGALATAGGVGVPELLKLLGL